MAFKVKAHLDGLAGTLQKLATVQKRTRTNLQRKAMRRVGSIILKAARKNLTKNRTGQLRKSLGMKVKAYKKSGVVIVIVGPRKGFKTTIPTASGKERPVDPVYYAHLKEKGRKAIAVKNKKVLSDGSNFYGLAEEEFGGHEFLRPAFDNNKQRCVDVIKETVRESIGEA